MSRDPYKSNCHLVERPIVLYIIWKFLLSWVRCWKPLGKWISVSISMRKWSTSQFRRKISFRTFLVINPDASIRFSSGFCMIINFVTAFEWYITWIGLRKISDPDRYRSGPARSDTWNFSKWPEKILECSTRPRLHYNTKFDPTYFRNFRDKNSRT